MLTVSDSFKKAIKSDVRELYGYVDVNYATREYEKEVTQTPLPLTLVPSDGSGLTKGSKVMRKYATLENNYTLLDGSHFVSNENTLYTENGFVSNDIFNNIGDNTIIIENVSYEQPLNGFTIYFIDNLPFDFTLNITTLIPSEDDPETFEELVQTINVTNNSSMVYQHIFSDSIYVKDITLVINSVDHRDNRVRISYIDFLISDLYYGDELVSFDVTEEIDLLVENIPTNTCSISLNNYPDETGGMKFDPINPVGLVPYLTENTTFTPYIGVLTEDNGVEYVPMGVFYLSDWSSDADGNVTLNGKNVIERLKNITITSDGTLLRNSFTGNTITTYLNNMTGYNFNFNNTGTYGLYYLRHSNLLDWLKAELAFRVIYYDSSNDFYVPRRFYITRNNIITLTKLNENSVDVVNRNQLIDDLKYETKSVINKVEITDITTYGTRYSSQKENVIEDSHTILNGEEYMWYYFDKYINYTSATFSYTVASGSGSATLIDVNRYMAYVKFTGTVGSVINVVYNAYIYEEPPTKLWTFTNDLKTGDTLSLDFHEYFNANDSALETNAKFYLTHDKKYKVTGSTIGDPSLESGDTISIQTRYTDSNNGYKDIIITKQKFTFDGGLSCELEGLGE